MAQSTTILGVTYAGRPAMNSTALRIARLEESFGAEVAQSVFDDLNRIATCFGGQPIDLAADMTLLPMEGFEVYPAARGQ